jgi:serine/threonine protein phosphatase PrpC
MAGEAQPELFDVAALSDPGTERGNNEDCCGTVSLGADHVLAVVADGISSMEGGEVASQKAVEVTIRVYQEQPADVAPVKRLLRAVQQANIEIHDMALIVPELRGMGTTITAVAVQGGQVAAAHVGDSRLLLVRDGQLTQLTKDHTVAAERARIGLVRKSKLREHNGYSTLTRCLGRELIASIDRLTTSVGRGDHLVVCTDGLYNVLPEPEIARLANDGASAADACRRIIDTANGAGTPDNLTAVVLRVTEAGPEPVRDPPRLGWLARTFRRNKGDGGGAGSVRK